MKKTWKRNLIAAGVLLVVCAGIYLNWYAGHSAADLTETLDAGKILETRRSFCSRSRATRW